MLQIPETWKQILAGMIRWRWLQWLMVLGIYVTVPRHRMGVSVVPIDEQGRILLLYHVFHPYARWGLPGGWLGRNEAPSACALRELHEETGLSGELGPVVYLDHEEDISHLSVAYLMEDMKPGTLTLSAEIVKANWFDPDDLPSPLLPFTQRAIAAALKVRARRTQREVK